MVLEPKYYLKFRFLVIFISHLIKKSCVVYYKIMFIYIFVFINSDYEKLEP